jgi:hypothetical protein
MASFLSKLITNVLGKDAGGKTPAKPGAPSARVQPPRHATPFPESNPPPRAAKALKGHVEVQGRTNVLVRDDDATEELLTLSEDADPRLDGIDPYNTGGFGKKDLWGNNGRR